MAVAPKPPEKSKIKQENKETRAQAWRRRSGKSHQMPPVEPFGYLVRCWESAGRLQNTGMGRSAISWQELDSWATRTGNDLMPWEFEAIRSMSIAFVGMLTEAEDINCPPPYVMEVGPIDKDRISDGLRKVFEALAKDK